jgi:hypothetical protein
MRSPDGFHCGVVVRGATLIGSGAKRATMRRSCPSIVLVRSPGARSRTNRPFAPGQAASAGAGPSAKATVSTAIAATHERFAMTVMSPS